MDHHPAKRNSCVLWPSETHSLAQRQLDGGEGIRFECTNCNNLSVLCLRRRAVMIQFANYERFPVARHKKEISFRLLSELLCIMFGEKKDQPRFMFFAITFKSKSKTGNGNYTRNHRPFSKPAAEVDNLFPFYLSRMIDNSIRASLWFWTKIFVHPALGSKKG